MEKKKEKCRLRLRRDSKRGRGRRPLRCGGKSKTHIKIAAKPQPTLLTPHSSLQKKRPRTGGPGRNGVYSVAVKITRTPSGLKAVIFPLCARTMASATERPTP